MNNLIFYNLIDVVEQEELAVNDLDVLLILYPVN